MIWCSSTRERMRNLLLGFLNPSFLTSNLQEIRFQKVGIRLLCSHLPLVPPGSPKLPLRGNLQLILDSFLLSFFSFSLELEFIFSENDFSNFSVSAIILICTFILGFQYVNKINYDAKLSPKLMFAIDMANHLGNQAFSPCISWILINLPSTTI